MTPTLWLAAVGSSENASWLWELKIFHWYLIPFVEHCSSQMVQMFRRVEKITDFRKPLASHRLLDKEKD
jgi:hypothetical protein